MSKKFTLFVDDTEIKALVTNKGVVETWASIPLEPGLVSGGAVVDEDRVAVRLKEQLKLLKISTKRVIIGLSGMNTLYRIFTMPELPDTLLPEAVNREAERAMPISPGEVYVSFQRIPSPAGEAKVFVATFPKNSTDTLVRTLRKAGLEPYLMDLAPLAFSRVVGVPRAVLANLQANYLDIVILIDRVPQVIRSLSLAEVESPQEKLATISEEIERTIAFFNSTEKEKPIDNTVPVLVCGEMVEQPESLQHISGRLGFTVSGLMAPLEAPDIFDACPFMVNIGLAYKEPEKGAAEFSLVNFNALPEVYAPKHIAVGNILAPVGIVASAGMVIIMVIVSTSSGTHSQALRFELTTIQSYLSQQQKDLTAGRTKLVQLQDQLKPLDAVSGTLESQLKSLTENRENINKDLSSVVNPPQAVSLLKASYSADKIIVSGTSTDRSSIYEYARSLMTSTRFSSVTVDSIEAVQVQITQPVAPSALEITPSPEETTPSPVEEQTLQVLLSWVDESNNETGFLVQRATDPGFSMNKVENKVEPNVTTFTDRELLPASTYYYRIIAFNVGGFSEPSNIISVVTLSVQPPTAPGSLSATTIKPAPKQQVQPEIRFVTNYNFSLTIQIKQPPKPTPTPTPTPTATPKKPTTPLPLK